jgi:uncharacterized cupin superfamily protein
VGDEPNVFGEIAWEREFGAARGIRLGPSAGLEQLGCSVFELDPGGQATPYHLHHGNEELLVVLDGELELRTPDGLRSVSKGAVVGFPTGPAGAHRLRNASSAKARYALVSTMKFPEVAEQLDTGTILPMSAPGEGWAFAADANGDYMALTIKAIEADPQSGGGGQAE